MYSYLYYFILFYLKCLNTVITFWNLIPLFLSILDFGSNAHF